MHLVYDWQREDFIKSSRQITIPANAHEILRMDHPDLIKLARRYQETDFPYCEDMVWNKDRIHTEDLVHFRGHNAYVFQDGSYNRNLFGYLLAYYYTKTIDRQNLLDKLIEDTAFGVLTYEFDGRLVSRDLIDSILEIYFLDDQINLLSTKGLSVLDIGAGYGRLAYRMISANPSIKSYLCADAVAISSYLSDYYLGYRGIKDQARMVPLDRIRSGFLSGSVDLAVNIHSFSECTLPMIEWWLELLAEKKVTYLMIVPNSINGLLTNSKEDFQPVLEKYSYRYLARQPKYIDPIVQKYGQTPTWFYLFQLDN